MPFEERTKETMREEFVKRVLSKEKSKSQLCREYGISRPSGDKWIKRYLEGSGLADKGKQPLHSPNKTPPEIERQIVAYRKVYPAIGAVKIHKMLQNEGFVNIPCPSTINAIFKRNGLITHENSLKSTPNTRFEKSYPNEMWQADFNGDFLMVNNERCHTLNIIDDFSRKSLCCTPLPCETYTAVRPRLETVFKTYGLPFSFLCDNGNPWGTAQSTGFTRFEVWLMELGILVLHGRFKHPQTQGKEERFNGSFQRELLDHTQIQDFDDAEEKFALYKRFYNEKRPHHALKLKVPDDVYTPSERKYPEKIENWEYPKEYEMRKVKSSGYLTYGGQGYFLSEAFGEKEVAVHECEQPGVFGIYFRQFIVGKIDVNKRTFVFKRAYLTENDPRLISR